MMQKFFSNTYASMRQVEVQRRNWERIVKVHALRMANRSQFVAPAATSETGYSSISPSTTILPDYLYVSPVMEEVGCIRRW